MVLMNGVLIGRTKTPKNCRHSVCHSGYTVFLFPLFEAYEVPVRWVLRGYNLVTIGVKVDGMLAVSLSINACC